MPNSFFFIFLLKKGLSGSNFLKSSKETVLNRPKNLNFFLKFYKKIKTGKFGYILSYYNE